ncbi:hypothetical protein IIV22_150L [Invertebrate iridescent virus 22]|uniref:Uncharacterized protein n=1 Tax=Invertebrate iridescent virus 22 TaxID=345198 RepID=S6DD02_9VIRU|nr:hypothetical protein IIV22_150L [Invertebrate iridescent virus 22]CCV01827.1 hypothetical protein IIV22_150L [Invertebrate iridescent virus 22]
MVELVTVFYSNESGNSKALLQQINNFNLIEQLNIKFINIDNNEIRDIVIKKFLVVPAIVVIQHDEISLYTGENAFEWFNMFLEKKEESINQEESVFSEEVKDNSENTPKSILELAAEISKDREVNNF